MQLLIKRLAVVGGIMTGRRLIETQIPRFCLRNFAAVRQEALILSVFFGFQAR